MSSTPPQGQRFDIDFDEEWSENEETDQRFSFSSMNVLPDAPKLGGGQHRTKIDGSEARHIGGISSAPPLFTQASTYPEVTSMRVWKYESGAPTSLGTIESSASEEDFIRKFIKAMPQEGDGSVRFAFRPLTITGEEIGAEFSIKISEDHATLTRLRNKAKTPTVLPNGQIIYPTISTDNSGQKEFFEVMRETLRAQQAALDSERAQIQELMAQVAQERIDLASNTATSVQMVSERMMEADRLRQENALRQENDRNEQQQKQMNLLYQQNMEMFNADKARTEQYAQIQSDREQTFFASMLANEQARSERELLRAKEERELDRQRMEMSIQAEQRRIEREREEYDRRERERMRYYEEQRRKDRDEQKEREAERRRQFEMRMKEADLASQRDREHAERMMQLQALQLQNEKSESFEGTLKRTLGWIKDMGMEPQDLISRVFGSNESESESSTLTSLAKIASTTGEILRSQRPPEPQYADPQMYQQQQLMMQQQQMIEQQQMLEQEQAEQMARAQQAEEMVQQLEQNEAEPQAPQSNLPIGQQKSARLALRRLVTELKTLQ